jgi:hypothetical protein
MTSSVLAPWLAAVAVVCGGCTATSPEEYVEIVEEARLCDEGDVCELAGGGTCICPMPVNGAAVDSVEEAAADVDCEGAVVECVSHSNLRCEEGRCVSDESP